MKVAQYIVMDRRINYSNLEEDKFSVEGTVLFPIGAVLPIIVNGTGCVGLAKVQACTLRETSSTVFFKVIEYGDVKEYEAIYLMYQTRSGNNSSSDDDYDAPTFGMPRASSTKKEKRNREGFTSHDFNRW